MTQQETPAARPAMPAGDEVPSSDAEQDSASVETARTPPGSSLRRRTQLRGLPGYRPSAARDAERSIVARTRHSRNRSSALIWRWFGAGLIRYHNGGSAPGMNDINQGRPSRWTSLSEKPPDKPQWPFAAPMK